MERPNISNYKRTNEFVRDMVKYRKKTSRHFSILQECKKLRRISPALVTLIASGKRRLTLDRVAEFAQLLQLTHHEGSFFREWLMREQNLSKHSPETSIVKTTFERKQSTAHLLKDWINPYVKDAFQLPEVAKNPQLIYSVLGTLASQKRIDRSIQFLLREGYLRKSATGKIVEDSPLHVVPGIPNKKIRAFHKAALTVASRALDQYDTHHRFANTLILSLNESSYRNLISIIEDFAARVQDFAEQNKDGKAMYQMTLNLSPTGGIHE